MVWLGQQLREHKNMHAIRWNSFDEWSSAPVFQLFVNLGADVGVHAFVEFWSNCVSRWHRLMIKTLPFGVQFIFTSTHHKLSNIPFIIRYMYNYIRPFSIICDIHKSLINDPSETKAFAHTFTHEQHQPCDWVKVTSIPICAQATHSYIVLHIHARSQRRIASII